MSKDTDPDWSFELRDANEHVALTKTRTKNGERLIIECNGARVTVDALALESLTWQEDSFFTELTGSPHEEGTVENRRGSDLQIGNEYTVVRLGILDTDVGQRLQVSSPKLGYSCRLDGGELCALATREVEFFSELLHTPYGPVDDHDHGGH